MVHTINIREVKENIFTAIQAASKKEKIYIGLSGGSSLDAIYNDFIDVLLELDKKITEKIYFCFLDERIVPLDDTESNYASVYKKFFGFLIKKSCIHENQIIKIDGESNNIAGDYSKKVPRIDIAFFGVGEDGHIASLFPHHQLLGDENKQYLSIYDSLKPPKKRITLSKNMIYDIETSFLFFIGEKKQHAHNLFLDKNIDYIQLPAKLVNNSKKVFLVVGE